MNFEVEFWKMNFRIQFVLETPCLRKINLFWKHHVYVVYFLLFGQVVVQMKFYVTYFEVEFWIFSFHRFAQVEFQFKLIISIVKWYRPKCSVKCPSHLKANIFSNNRYTLLFPKERCKKSYWNSFHYKFDFWSHKSGITLVFRNNNRSCQVCLWHENVCL